MKNVLLLCFALSFGLLGYSQNNSKVSSIDFVQVLNENKAEALYYYRNNWRILREAALKQKYISSYNLLEIEPSEATPYHFILITTYANNEQYDNREKHFQDLIESSGGLKLLNEKEPKDFRKVIHGQDSVKQW